VDTIVVAGSDSVSIPAWMTDYDSFCRWLCSDDFPEEGKVCFILGKVWVDLSMEEFFGHNQVRGEFGSVLHRLVKQTNFGRFVSEGMRYNHPETQLSTEPDGMIVSHEAMRTGRVRLTAGKVGESTILVGSPEILIEVVSESSEAKDTEWTMSAYFDAGVMEYWVIDARDEDDARFDIYKRGKKEFVATRKPGGWVKSAVLGKSFRLVQSEDGGGKPEFTLEVR
jgi:Uma2 family endonuclease